MPRDAQWPGRPSLIEGESLSSWLARIANANALSTAELCRLIDPSGYRALRDLDRHADSLLISRIAALFGEEPEKVVQATFRRWAGEIYEADDGRIRLEWAPPAGRIGGIRCFGQQVCPLCLTAEVQPYLRLNWRLSFLTACDVHAATLLDRCSTCGEPFHPLKCISSSGFRCPACGADPASAKPEPVPEASLRTQRRLFAIAAKGWCDLGAYGPVYAFVALKILALMCRLLAGGSHALPLRRWVLNRMKLGYAGYGQIRQVRDHSILPPKDRAALVAMAYYLLEEWPDRFITASEAVNLYSSHLRKRHKEELPFALQNVIDFHLKQRHEIGGKEEARVVAEILKSRGEPATYRNLVSLAGRKRAAFETEAQRSVTGDKWGQGRYWKLNGISPDLKSAVRIAAHNAGLNVAVWVEKILRRELGLKACSLGDNLDG